MDFIKIEIIYLAFLFKKKMKFYHFLYTIFKKQIKL